MMKWVLISGILFSLFLQATAAKALGVFSLSYGGRLANANDEAEVGPVDLEVGFYSAVKGGTQITAILKSGVALSDGIFQVDLDLTATERQIIFSDAQNVVWVEIVDKTHKKTYSRQMLSAVPYAVAAQRAQTVPVDGATVQFGPDGKLKAIFPSTPIAGGDATGVLTNLTVTKLQGKPVTATGATDGDVLKFDGPTNTWKPGAISGAAGGTVTSITAGSGLTAGGGAITGTGTISIAANGVTNSMLAGSIAQSNVTNLTSDLASKASTGHTHTTSDITGLTSDFAGKANVSHTHTESEITNLVTDLAAKSSSTHTHSSLDASDGTPTNALGIDANGDVGIGTTNPNGSKLAIEKYDYSTASGELTTTNSYMEVNVTTNQASGANRTSVRADTYISGTTTGSVDSVNGVHAIAANGASTTISTITGTLSEATSFASGANVDKIVGALQSGKVDSGTVRELSGGAVWAQVTGGSVTDMYGLHVEDVGISGGAVANRYGIFISDFSGSATNNFGIYQDGASHKNYFGGNVGIGSDSPTAKLDVAGNVKLGSAGVAFASMGACTTSSVTVGTAYTNSGCTGISTGVAVTCSPSTAQGAGVVWSARGYGANSVQIVATAVGVASVWNCMWVKP